MASARWSCCATCTHALVQAASCAESACGVRGVTQTWPPCASCGATAS